MAEHYQPPGTRFYDGSTRREMLLVRHPGHHLDGWLCYKHVDGQWVSLREATKDDFDAVERTERMQLMDSTEPLRRTAEDIIARMEHVKQRDFLGVERMRLNGALDYDVAKQFLGEDVTREQWEGNECRTTNMAGVIREIRNYLDFAWDKANCCRGLSAARAMAHFAGLVWLMGPDADYIVESMFDHYRWYGKPKLVLVSNVVGFNWRAADDGMWRDSENGPVTTTEDALKQLGL